MQASPASNPDHASPRHAGWFNHPPLNKPLQRWPALLVFVSCTGVLGLGYWLTPDTAGIGTHQQLGLSSCSFLDATGLPCATCGMTTSTSLVAHGRLIESFINQPAGALFALTLAMLSVASFWSLISGMRLYPIGLLLSKPKVWILIGLIIGGSWVYKIFSMINQ